MEIEKNKAFLKEMIRIRNMELEIASLFRRGKMPAFAPHLYVGEEAIAAGVCGCLRRNDYLLSTHRGHGHCLAKGADMKLIISEVCGKRTGCCGGKGGTMHMVFPEVGILGTNGIVGAGMPISVGVGLSVKLKGTDQVVVCFFGDGAANNGTFHESLNMASLWKLPIIFICENNQYATSVHVSRSTSVKDISIRAKGYGIPGRKVDGNHVDTVYEASLKAVESARNGDGPSLLECKTYRIRGHYEGDPTWDYRTKEEVEKAKRKDPILYWKRKLVKLGQINNDEIAEIEKIVEKEVAEASLFAEKSPFPKAEDAMLLEFSN